MESWAVESATTSVPLFWMLFWIEHGRRAGLALGQQRDCRPVKIRAACLDERQEASSDEIRKRHVHLERLRRLQRKTDIFIPQGGLEAGRIVALPGDQSAIGLVYGRAEQRADQKVEILFLVDTGLVD